MYAAGATKLVFRTCLLGESSGRLILRIPVHPKAMALTLSRHLFSSAPLRQKTQLSYHDKEFVELPLSSAKVCDSLNEDSVFKKPARTGWPTPLGLRGALPVAFGQPAQMASLPGQYSNLAKVRLSGLVVITAAFGYVMAPCTFHLVSFSTCILGTFLLAASANGLNQVLEASFDARMKRTKHRPVVTGQLTMAHAKWACGVAALSGYGLLFFGNNLLTASLGLCNLALYSGIYTSMKRTTIYNTWMGSLVGAIPPLMGWAAVSDSLSPGAWVLAAILYAWQFPHFHALSWNLRRDYVKGGYRMACNERPDLCCASTLRHSAGLLLLCSAAAPLTGLTTWTFAVDSLPLNLYLLYLSFVFYKNRDSQSARKLFRFTLAYLPIVLVLMYISKSFDVQPQSSV